MTDRLKEIKERESKATDGPWCWESIAEKSNEFAVGLAIDSRGNPISGEIPHGCMDEDGEAWLEDEIIRRTEIGINECGQANFSDADFIAHARMDIPYLLARLERAEATLEEIDKHKNCYYQGPIAKDGYVLGIRDGARVAAAIARKYFTELEAEK